MTETPLAGIRIRIEGLRHSYPSPNGAAPRLVLDLPALEMEPGAHLLLRGVSGSGKTTLLHILAGLLPPSSGQVWLDDEPIYLRPEAAHDRLRARTIGYVFQTHLLAPTLTAVENVEMPLIFAGERSNVRRQALDALDRLGLADHARHRPAQMSAGQRLRVAIARALVNQPRLLLADEPTAALDQANGVLVVDLLQEFVRARRATLIVASHDPQIFPRFADVLNLRDGRGTVTQLPLRPELARITHVL